MPRNCSSHDYSALIRKWRALSKKTPLRVGKVSSPKSLPFFEVTNGLLSREKPCLYISAGIHGDEPAPCWALLEWAEKNHGLLQDFPVLFYPCLNPWGFVHNSRLDEYGEDLNRIWGNEHHPLTEQIFKRIKGLSFFLSLNLHEDFDANGIYIYEPYRGGRTDRWTNQILQAGKKFLPLDTRKRIDGKNAKNGIIRPRVTHPPKEGVPEALYLFQNHGTRNFTIETPSEASLEKRILSHQAMIKESLLLATRPR